MRLRLGLRPLAATLVAECFWPDAHTEHVAEAAERVRVRAAAARIGYAGSLFFPGDDVVLYLFDCPSAEDVRAVCERAGVTCERVLAAVHRR